jgi:serine-type D-Ala-D-Ala carboxypeptidase
MKSAEISNFLQERISAEDFPSAVYLIAEKGEIVFQDALGFAVVEPEKIAATIDTIYDLASLTKVLVTGLLCAKLIERGEINFQDRITEIFTEFDTHEKHDIAIQNLLTHTSGFQAWLPFYLFVNSIPEMFQFIALQSLEKKINAKVVYSDFNFITLGFLIEEIYYDRLHNISREEIFEPLNLQNTFFNPPKDLQKRIAASEFGNEFEKQTCVEQGFDVSKYNWRECQIWGEVHDGNAYFMNGVSGHAGLFSNAFETFKIAQQFLSEETVLLKPETCKLFRTNFTPGLNEARSIAFQLAETKDSTASKALSKDSFGHLGFTGTSLWVEPETRRIFILLANRTHNRALPFANINSVRRKFHELAVEALNER